MQLWIFYVFIIKDFLLIFSFRTVCVALLVSWCMPCACCSWFISLRPGETARWRLWIQNSSIVTASPPAALTAKRATWWTTATAAWCTCPVGNLPCVASKLHQWQMIVQTSKTDVDACFLCPKATHPTAPLSCTKNVLTQLSVRIKGFVHMALSNPIHSHLTSWQF